MSAEINKQIELEIAHILFIDIVGYSKLSINQQRAVVDELTEVVRSSDQYQKAEAAGRLIKIPAGDGMALVFYTSPEAPAQCAVEISRALKEHPRLQLRMGVHSGPVSGVIDVNGHANLAGAGLNMAQRVMACGDAGHILVSKHVAEDLEEYEHWRPLLHDLGVCEVKHGMRVSIVNLHADQVGNPQLPKKFQTLKKHSTRMRWAGTTAALLAISAIVAGIAMVSRYRGRSTPSTPEKSIAVLPFENLSTDQANAFFAEGIQDEILNDLAKVADLKVISRTSVMQYKSGAKRNLREIANALGVAHVVEGTVQRAANRVRVSAQLIDARTDNHLWAEHYDRSLDDVFAIQTEIAKIVVDQLEAKLSPVEKAQIDRKPTENGEAYLAYVQAHNLQTANEDIEKLKQAEQLYDRAIQLDPKFALAFARYSQLESWIMHVFEPTPARRDKARALAERAFQLQPDLPEAHLALGFAAYYCDNDYDTAAKEFAIAQRGLPNEAEAYLAVGAIQRRQGKWAESNASWKKAASLNPKDAWVLQNLAINYEMLRNFDAANKAIDRALQLDPHAVGAWEIKAKLAIKEKGDFSVADKALAVLEAAPQNSDTQKIQLADLRITVFLYLRKFDEVLREADKIPDQLIATFPGALCNKYTTIGGAKKALHDEAGARAVFLKAKGFAEAEIKQVPKDAEAHARLAEGLAWLGEKEAALAEINHAAELLPESKDAVDGPDITETAAEIHAILGDAAGAVNILDGLLNRPSPITVSMLKVNPVWDSIRQDPRFQALLDKPKSADK